MTRSPPGPHACCLGRRMARSNQLVTNHVTLRFAGRVPYFGVVKHRGRKSGRSFRTPVRLPDHRGVPDRVTYGSDSQWVKNVSAAGEAQILTRGQTYRVVEPRLVHDATHEHVPGPMRLMLRAVRVEDFLELRRAD